MYESLKCSGELVNRNWDVWRSRVFFKLVKVLNVPGTVVRVE